MLGATTGCASLPPAAVSGEPTTRLAHDPAPTRWHGWRLIDPVVMDACDERRFVAVAREPAEGVEGSLVRHFDLVGVKGETGTLTLIRIEPDPGSQTDRAADLGSLRLEVWIGAGRDPSAEGALLDAVARRLLLARE